MNIRTVSLAIILSLASSASLAVVVQPSEPICLSYGRMGANTAAIREMGVPITTVESEANGAAATTTAQKKGEGPLGNDH